MLLRGFRDSNFRMKRFHIRKFIVHMIFEYVENTKYGMSIINNFVYWPGGKDRADSLINSLGDQFYAQLGWVCAYIVCNM